MSRPYSILAAASLFAATSAMATPAHLPDDLRLNEIQVIGTHNSYRTDLAPATLAWLKKISPRAAEALDYRHGSLTSQLDSGVRQLEIDIYADTKGGAYSHPRGPEWIRKAGLTPDPDTMPPASMQGTDFKVMHIVDIDQRSNCEPFKKCLEIIRDWSDAHPNHLPVIVDLETKQDIPFKSDAMTFTTPEVFTPAIYDRLDREIVSVIGREKLLTPDDVRGSAPSVNAAIRTKGWPSLNASRGKLIFVFDRPQDTERYVLDHAGLKGRIVFTNGRPGAPDAAYTEMNEGFAGQKDAGLNNEKAAKEIPELVRQGYLVRTRSDANTVEARANDLSRRKVAFESGAQIISTDYPALEPAPWHDYRVAFPDNAVARCNPVNAPKDCDDKALISDSVK